MRGSSLPSGGSVNDADFMVLHADADVFAVVAEEGDAGWVNRAGRKRH